MQRKYLVGMGLAATVALIGASVSACGSDSKADAVFSCNDATAAPTGGGAPTQNCHAPGHLTVLWMPDGFRNVAFGCNGTTGVYVTSRGWDESGTNLPSLPSGISTVPNDPACH